MSDSVSLSEIAAKGERLSTLEALRDRLAREIERSDSSAATAALSRQFVSVLEVIAGLTPARPKGTVLDEVTARRAARGSASTGVARAAGERRRG